MRRRLLSTIFQPQELGPTSILRPLNYYNRNLRTCYLYSSLFAILAVSQLLIAHPATQLLNYLLNRLPAMSSPIGDQDNSVYFNEAFNYQNIDRETTYSDDLALFSENSGPAS